MALLLLSLSRSTLCSHDIWSTTYHFGFLFDASSWQLEWGLNSQIDIIKVLITSPWIIAETSILTTKPLIWWVKIVHHRRCLILINCIELLFLTGWQKWTLSHVLALLLGDLRKSIVIIIDLVFAPWRADFLPILCHEDWLKALAYIINPFHLINRLVSYLHLLGDSELLFVLILVQILVSLARLTCCVIETLRCRTGEFLTIIENSDTFLVLIIAIELAKWFLLLVITVWSSLSNIDRGVTTLAGRLTHFLSAQKLWITFSKLILALITGIIRRSEEGVVLVPFLNVFDQSLLQELMLSDLNFLLCVLLS